MGRCTDDIIEFEKPSADSPTVMEDDPRVDATDESVVTNGIFHDVFTDLSTEASTDYPAEASTDESPLV
ncbi:hypothetical protein L1987_15174 [Smallanthus sonchifolius]|uniref:Uncharacterized protein n=1 Tax=Smallanthus sonchifolius TaxID=185202 RepID=A0ACB9J6E4_9ASTR|nr:hypothetical protein L1987_15174 [Smallanthus sonchifolius]